MSNPEQRIDDLIKEFKEANDRKKFVTAQTTAKLFLNRELNAYPDYATEMSKCFDSDIAIRILEEAKQQLIANQNKPEPCIIEIEETENEKEMKKYRGPI